MKKYTMVFVCCLFSSVLSGVLLYSQSQDSPWDFSVITDFAYYPKSNPIAGTSDSHFAPLTGAYSGLEARVTGIAGYSIPVPFSDNPLVSGNTLRFYGAFELSPVSVEQAIGVSFSPIAFLNFDIGTSIAAGWYFEPLGIQGLAVWDQAANEYKNMTTGLFEAWFQGTFMFDLAAIIPGDWNHVVTMDSFKVYYSGLTTGGENGRPWLYQGSGEKANGWKYLASFLIGYQMPIVLQTVGVQAELEGYLNANEAYNEIYHDMNPGFMTVHISPIMVFEFTEKDALTLQVRFSSRQSFTQTYSDKSERLQLDYVGREWYFDRIALSYKHSF